MHFELFLLTFPGLILANGVSDFQNLLTVCDTTTSYLENLNRNATNPQISNSTAYLHAGLGRRQTHANLGMDTADLVGNLTGTITTVKVNLDSDQVGCLRIVTTLGSLLTRPCKGCFCHQSKAGNRRCVQQRMLPAALSARTA